MEERKSRVSRTSTEGINDFNFLSDLVNGNDIDFKEYSQNGENFDIFSTVGGGTAGNSKKSLEEYCIFDYLAVNKDVAVLYDELGRSNEILDRIENIVTNFQQKLGGIADDVSKLQEKSQNYTTKLNNRKALEKELHEFLDGILLSPHLVRDLIQNDVDLEYVKKLEEFNKVLKNVEEVSKHSPESKAITDVLNEIEKLTTQVCYKIKVYMKDRFYNLHKDKTNFQIIQESNLVKFRPLNIFLRDHNPEDFGELTTTYSEYMSKRYQVDCREYCLSIARLVQEKITKNDVVIVEEAKYKSATADIETFELEEREAILSKIQDDPIL